jgi:NADPH:quinone reductase-like Zn-dependent oxidoreductase
VLGSEFAGVVERVGSSATRFAAGDRVYGYLGQTMGASAEYLTIAENKAVAHAPGSMSLEEASTVPYGALMAMNLLKRVPLEQGMRVLVIGASGGIGSAAVQLAKHAGAHVTGVAGTARLDYARALGADRVIDYKSEDYTTGPARYDLVIDVLGRSTFRAIKRVLTPAGRYLRVSFKLRELLQALWSGLFSSRKLIVGLATEQPGDLDQIRELIESGHYKTIVDRCFPLAAAADAHRYMESGTRTGAVVVTVGD